MKWRPSWRPRNCSSFAGEASEICPKTKKKIFNGVISPPMQLQMRLEAFTVNMYIKESVNYSTKSYSTSTKLY